MKKKRAMQEHRQTLRNSGFLVLSIISILLLSFNANAQTLEAGAFGGAAYYLGDLNPQKHFSENDISYGAVLKYNLNQRLAIGFSATQANIKADANNYNIDHINPEANLSTQISELALVGELNFLPYAIDDRNTSWTPYIFGGAAVFMDNSTRDFNLSSPFGLGLKLSPFKKIGLNLFWGARKTFTDNLDYVASIDYQGYNDDWYVFYGLNITFAFRLKKDTSCRNLISMNSY